MTATGRLLRESPTAEDAVHALSDKAAGVSSAIRRDLEDVGHSIADSASGVAATVSDRLKSVGVEADALAAAAKDEATVLQKLVADEMRKHPLRTLGVAAAIGVVVGLMSSR
ncbi:MAG: hypothetical protein ACRC7G_15650 [Beijerinckiaceae bacterium]